jgi:hypothetical protein
LMARTRNIKPSFFINDELAEIEPFGRLLYIGLWTLADRKGRLEDRPKRIKVELFPYDNIDVDQLLNQLAGHRFIIRYQVDGERYISIPKFLIHQNPHPKESASLIPPAPDEIAELHGKQVASREKQLTLHEEQVADPADLDPSSLILDPRSLILDQDLKTAAATNIVPIVTPEPQKPITADADAVDVAAAINQSENPLDVMDELACEVLGRVCTSPLDIEAMKQMLVATGGDTVFIRKKVMEIKSAYKPQYKGAKIRSFSYFLSGVLEAAALQKARAEPLQVSRGHPPEQEMTEEERAKIEKLNQEILALMPPSAKGDG